MIEATKPFLRAMSPADRPEEAHPNGFRQRYARWQVLHRQEGPGRSYPHAWRLPELARPLGQEALVLAQEALALDLYTLGRFPESLAALPKTGSESASGITLRQRLDLVMMNSDAVLAEGDDLEQAYQAYLLGQPFHKEAIQVTTPEAQALSVLLSNWANEDSPAAGHLAVARLRRLNPSLGSQGEALMAEACFRRSPRWSVVWLDHALDQVEHYSQHHLKARLMGLKARALAAAGEVGESARFRKQAQALAERQGARLYLERFIDPA